MVSKHTLHVEGCVKVAKTKGDIPYAKLHDQGSLQRGNFDHKPVEADELSLSTMNLRNEVKDLKRRLAAAELTSKKERWKAEEEAKKRQESEEMCRQKVEELRSALEKVVTDARSAMVEVEGELIASKNIEDVPRTQLWDLEKRLEDARSSVTKNVGTSDGEPCQSVIEWVMNIEKSANSSLSPRNEIQDKMNSKPPLHITSSPQATDKCKRRPCTKVSRKEAKLEQVMIITELREELKKIREVEMTRRKEVTSLTEKLRQAEQTTRALKTKEEVQRQKRLREREQALKARLSSTGVPATRRNSISDEVIKLKAILAEKEHKAKTLISTMAEKTANAKIELERYITAEGLVAPEQTELTKLTQVNNTEAGLQDFEKDADYENEARSMAKETARARDDIEESIRAEVLARLESKFRAVSRDFHSDDISTISCTSSDRWSLQEYSV